MKLTYLQVTMRIVERVVDGRSMDPNYVVLDGNIIEKEYFVER